MILGYAMDAESASPLLGGTPRWLMHTSRGLGSARYLFRLSLLVTVCVAVGVVVSSVFQLDRRPPPIILPGDSFDAQSDYPPGFLEHAGPGEPGSFIDRISHGIDSLKQWGNGPKHPGGDVLEPSLIAKITLVTGDPNIVYERALRTHILHNRLHGYPMFTLRQSIFPDVWSKPAYIMSVILHELQKPVHRRLQWLLWIDADTIVLNPHIPVERFLPPNTKEWEDVNLLVSHDFNGLNNGVFPIRVCPWSVELLSAVLTYRHYKPDDELVFRDQSAMGYLLETPRYERHTVKVPQRWFNAYMGELNETLQPYQVRPGDLLVHFAGINDRDFHMERWLERTDQHLPEWEVEFKHTTYSGEIKSFWADESSRRKPLKEQVSLLKKEWERRREIINPWLDKHWDGLEEEVRKRARQWSDKLEEAFMRVDDYGLQPALLEEKFVQSVDAFKPILDDIEKSSKDLLDRAVKAVARCQMTLIGLDLDAEGGAGAERELERTKQSVKTLELAIQSRLFSEGNMNHLLEDLSDKEHELENKISDLSGHEFKFKDVEEEEKKKAEAERIQQEEEEERKRLEEEKKKKEQAEAERLQKEKDEAAARTKADEQAKAKADDKPKAEPAAQAPKPPPPPKAGAPAEKQGGETQNQKEAPPGVADITSKANQLPTPPRPTDSAHWVFDDDKFRDWKSSHESGEKVPELGEWWWDDEAGGTEPRKKADGAEQGGTKF